MLIVVLALVAIFGMVVLVVDVGGALVVRQQMVRSADSASLAAAYSYAKKQANCGTDDPTVRTTVALPYATSNLAASITTYTTDCTAQTVTVGVESNMRQFLFAPIIGGPSQRTVHATATALWGPLGGGNAVPIVLDSGTLQGECDVPDGITEGETCAFWYDNNDLGNASWGFMNLDMWDVEPDANCSNAGANDRSEWIIGGYPQVLSLNGPPAPTYVCVDTGHTTRDWQDLFSQKGETKLFPVNDCTGQVDKDGNVAECPATPDKYDIIGFTSLVINEVYKGNDPKAIGTAGASDTCTVNNYDINPGILDLNTLLGPGGGCPPSAPDTILYDSVHIYERPGIEYAKCPAPGPGCDYTYNESTHQVTWLLPGTQVRRIVFDWAINGTQGACGIRPSDPNAICLVTMWDGYQVGPGPVGGANFGAAGVRLLK